MTVWLELAVYAACLAAAVGLAVDLVRDHAADDRVFAVVVVVELLTIVQAVVGCVLVGGASSAVSVPTFLSYLISLPLVLPVGAFWSISERNRSGTAVLLVAVATVAAMELRLASVWGVG